MEMPSLEDFTEQMVRFGGKIGGFNRAVRHFTTPTYLLPTHPGYREWYDAHLREVAALSWHFVGALKRPDGGFWWDTSLKNALLEEARKTPLERDPGPGHWDTNSDMTGATGHVAKGGHVFTNGGHRFRIADIATGHCPSGPCGSAKVLYALGPV